MTQTTENNRAFQAAFDRYRDRRGQLEWGDEDITDLAGRMRDYPDLCPPDLLTEEPVATIVTPLEVFTERPEQAVFQLQQLQRAAQELGPIEVWLWANYNMNLGCADDYPIPEGATYESVHAELEGLYRKTEQQAELCFGNLIDAICSAKNIDHGVVRIRPALSEYYDNTSMNLKRSDAMEVRAYTALEYGFSPNHKVIWLDADMTRIGRYALKNHCAAIDANPGKLVKPNLKFSNGSDQCPRFSEMDEPTRAAAAYGILRQLVERCAPYSANVTYIDEGALGMTIGDWLKYYGLMQPRRMDLGAGLHHESTALIENMRNHVLFKERKRSFHMEDYVAYAADAHYFTSNRKMQKLAALSSTKDMVYHLQTPDYRLFSEGEVVEDPYLQGMLKHLRTDFVSVEAMRKVVKDLAAHHLIEAYEPGAHAKKVPQARRDRYYEVSERVIKHCGFQFETEAEVEKAKGEVRMRNKELFG